MNIKLIETIRKLVSELDSSLDPKEETYIAGCVLLGSASIGALPKELSEAFGVNKKLMKKLDTNWRKQNIWSGQKVSPSDWWDKKAGGVAFWMDVLCGRGLVERVHSEMGRKGGKSGKGNSKSRGDSEYYKNLALKKATANQ